MYGYKSDTGMSYSDCTDNVAWTTALRTHESYLLEVPELNPLTSIIGWHLGTLWADFMHSDWLGIRLQALGSTMVELIQEGAVPAGPPGPWKDRLTASFRLRYPNSKSYLQREGLARSHPRFSAGQLHLNTLSS